MLGRMQQMVVSTFENAARQSQETATENVETVLPTAVRCICVALELAQQRGCLYEVLAALPESDAASQGAAFSVRSPKSCSHLSSKWRQF